MLHKTNIHVANQVECVKINLTHDVQVKDPLYLKSFSYTLLTINNNYQLYIVRNYCFNQQRKVSSYI